MRISRLFAAIAVVVGILLITTQLLSTLSPNKKAENDDYGPYYTMSTKLQDSDNERLQRKCQKAVDRLVKLKINFLAIDFDQTMIDIHTGGRWKGTARELVPHLRPLFVSLLPVASSQNIRIGIVTFSGQTSCIRNVLEEQFPSLADSIVIRGNDRTWSYEGNGMKMGKQEHMASAAEELMSQPGPNSYNNNGSGVVAEDVRKDTTLLIDDDPNNIRLSLRDGTRAIWFNPKDPMRLLDNILLLK